MGSSQSTPKSNTDRQNTVAPTVPSAPSLCSCSDKLHLVLAFFAGILLTLLLMALVFVITKSYRKCHSSPQALGLHSDPPAQFLSTPEEERTSASMTFKTSEEKSGSLTANHPADSGSIVYAQIKVATPPGVSNKT